MLARAVARGAGRRGQVAAGGRGAALPGRARDFGNAPERGPGPGPGGQPRPADVKINLDYLGMAKHSPGILP
ncbi:kelch-like protein 13 [Grus japonensis]|uniref:Kelch-like protein 13 n=1 Tax=Grus japonensis TaxID=30415 RepID=A0ABC9XBX1_GRUJA